MTIFYLTLLYFSLFYPTLTYRSLRLQNSMNSITNTR